MTKKLDEAIEQLKRHNAEYYQKLFSFACGWVKTMFKPFTSEDLKKAFYALGNAPPAQPNVFGGVVRELSRNELIFKHNYATAKSQIAKGRLLNVWISKEFKQKQSSNARGDKGTLNLFE